MELFLGGSFSSLKNKKKSTLKKIELCSPKIFFLKKNFVIFQEEISKAWKTRKIHSEEFFYIFPKQVLRKFQDDCWSRHIISNPRMTSD